MCMCDTEGWRAHPGSVGKAIFGEPHVVDEDGRELSAGEEGLIYFSGGQRFEYHRDPEKTAAVYRGEMATLGDVGRLDEDGYLYLTDRQSNMIISGGCEHLSAGGRERISLPISPPSILQRAYTANSE